MTTRIWLTTTMMATILGCAPESSGTTTAYVDDGWDAASDTATTAFGSSGGAYEEREANVHWSASFDGTATDLLRTTTQNLVAGHDSGIATVWRVAGDEGAEQIWSSGVMGTDAKLVSSDGGGVRVVALAPGGFAFAPLDGSSEPTFVSLPAESPRLIEAVPGAGDELWVAIEVAPWEAGQVLRVAGDGTVVAAYSMRDLDAIVGVLRHGGQTLVYGNSGDGEGWQKCIPDDGNPSLASVGIGFRLTGAWVDGSVAMIGFDAGGAGCAVEVDCEDAGDDEMEELLMPMPVQATSPWSYGRNANQILIARQWEGYAYDLAGAELVAIDGDADGLAIAVLDQGETARVVELSQ